MTVNVARTEDEAERQARGEDVLSEKTEAEEAVVAAEELFEEGAGPKAKAKKPHPRIELQDGKPICRLVERRQIG